jgi:hypothetical protein
MAGLQCDTILGQDGRNSSMFIFFAAKSFAEVAELVVGGKLTQKSAEVPLGEVKNHCAVLCVLIGTQNHFSNNRKKNKNKNKNKNKLSK